MFFSENSRDWIRIRKESLYHTCEKKPQRGLIYHIWGQESTISYFLPYTETRQTREATKTHGQILCPKSYRPCADVIYYSRLGLSSLALRTLLRESGFTLSLQRVGAGPKRNSAALSFKEEEQCRGGGEKSGRRLQPLPRKMQGRKRPQSSSPNVKPQSRRGSPRTRVYWIAPCPAQGFPETPASGCPKELWVSEEQKKPHEPNSGCSNQSTGILDPASRTSFKRPDRPPERGNPDGPARMRIGCICHQESLRMPQSGEALGVTCLGSRSGSHNLPCKSTPRPQKPRALRPALKTPFLNTEDNREGWEGGKGKIGGDRGEELFREKVGFEFFIIIFHLLVHQLKS